MCVMVLQEGKIPDRGVPESVVAESLLTENPF